MTEPISLSDFRYRRAIANSTALPLEMPSDSTSHEVSDDIDASLVHGGDFLSAAVLRKLNPDTELGRFFDVAAETISAFEACSQELSWARNLAADDKVMEARQLLGELFILRDTSDAVGVIVLAALEATSRVIAITDAPELPKVCARVLRKLWAAPFMDFIEAAEFAHDIESASNTKAVDEFGALVNELLEAQVEAPLE